MISDVVLKNKMYYVLDERGKEISHNWDSLLGDLLGFSGTFMVFRKNNMYYSYATIYFIVQRILYNYRFLYY